MSRFFSGLDGGENAGALQDYVWLYAVKYVDTVCIIALACRRTDKSSAPLKRTGPVH